MTMGARALAVVFFLLGSLIMGVGQAEAAPERVVARAIGMDAPIVYVNVKNGRLQIGSNPRVLYSQRGADPPCDATGSTFYGGHAVKNGDGVADRLLQLKIGDIIRVGGCRFKVIKKRVWDDGRDIRSLSTPGGPPLIHVGGCKVDNYDDFSVITARLIGNPTPFRAVPA